MDRQHRTPTTDLLAAAGSLLLLAVLGCASAEPAEMTAELWRQDLSYLARALPAKHGNALPDPYRTALRLRYWFDLPVAEIADALGVAEGTAKSYLHRGRSRMLRLLEDTRRESVRGGPGGCPQP